MANAVDLQKTFGYISKALSDVAQVKSTLLILDVFRTANAFLALDKSTLRQSLQMP